MSNPIAQLACLAEKGYITEAQRDQLGKILASLPTSQADLSALMASVALIQLDASGVFHSAPVGVESLTSSDTADIKTLTVPTGATRAIVSIHGNNIIFRTDGANPAVGVGHYGTFGENISIGGSLSDFKFISTSTTDATIFVSYF
jgi:hypothetical protein